MNPPSSGCRRTMAGRLQIFADEKQPRMDANSHEYKE
jgi:hypothetical protein